jgi:putative transposase
MGEDRVMPRPNRRFRPGYAYHVTVRCNNRAFDLRRREARAIVLHAIRRALRRFDARLYGLAIMNNHVHYLVQTSEPADLSRLMHWLNWNVAMRMNRLLNRTGHFWEARYHAVPVSNRDQRHVLNVLRYIHGNPMAAKVRKGSRDPFTNYGAYVDGREDGLTSWHPQFLRLGRSLDACCHRYRRFCARYRPAVKKDPVAARWGQRVLAGVRSELGRRAYFARRGRKPEQSGLLFEGVNGSSDGTSPTRSTTRVPRRIRWDSRESVPGMAQDSTVSPWLEDPIRACLERFVLVNGLRSG